MSSARGGWLRSTSQKISSTSARSPLKVLKPELAAVIGGERFVTEIRTTANLQHPHILALFDSGEADGFLYCVMPYIEGESLRDRLDRERQLPVDEAVKIASAVADALDYAHRHDVIHRDIKPENTGIRRGYSVSRDGTLVLLEGDAGALGQAGAPPPTNFLIMDFTGQSDPVRPPPSRKTNPRFSPDGRSIAYEFVAGERGLERDIYTFDLVTGTNTRITFEGDNEVPVWSPDGTKILFNSLREGSDGEDLFIKAADNSAPAQSALSQPGDEDPWAWLSDDVVVFHSNLQPTSTANRNLYTYQLSGGSEPTPYLQAPWSEYDFTLSPDGSVAALVSTETEVAEVWLRDYPVPEGKWQVSSGGGVAPRWSPDGGTLYYWRTMAGPDTLFSVRVDREPSVIVRQREPVLATLLQGFGWDLHPDGERFIVTESAQSAPAAQGASATASSERYLVVYNWFQELKERVGN